MNRVDVKHFRITNATFLCTDYWQSSDALNINICLKFLFKDIHNFISLENWVYINTKSSGRLTIGSFLVGPTEPKAKERNTMQRNCLSTKLNIRHSFPILVVGERVKRSPKHSYSLMNKCLTFEVPWRGTWKLVTNTGASTKPYQWE